MRGQKNKSSALSLYDSLHHYGSFYLLVSILFLLNSLVWIGFLLFLKPFCLIHFSLSASPVAEVPEDDFILAEKKYLSLIICCLKLTSPCPPPPLNVAISSFVIRPSMPDFSPYKMGGMSLNPLRSLYDDINNILLYRTLQSTATRSLLECNKSQDT